jgi:hypothetical protein
MTKIWRGVVSAARARPWVVLAVIVAALVLQVILPPLVLSLTRKPWTYAAVNPWLRSLPQFLTSSAPFGDKVSFLSRLALFWVSADGGYGEPEWGFAVDTMDALRFAATAVLIGLYAALVMMPRARSASSTAGRSGGALAAVASMVSLSTGPCSVMGCGAPVLPVVGLAFAGLSSGTLAVLSMLSRVVGAAVLVVLSAAVLYLGWQAGGRVNALGAPTVGLGGGAPHPLR